MQPRPYRSDMVHRPTGSTIRGRQRLNHGIIGAPSHPRFFSQLSLIGANSLISNMMHQQQAVDCPPDPEGMKPQIDRQLSRRDRPRPAHRVQLFKKPGALGRWMAAGIAVVPVLLVRELAGERPHLLRTEGVRISPGVFSPHCHACSSSAAGHGWSPRRASARGSGTPSISRLVIVAARAPRGLFDRSLSAMANTAP
jgi:hypothetical protein